MESAVARGRQGLTAPIEVSSGNRKIYRLSRRGNRRLNHVIHMAAVSQIRRRHSDGRADQKAMCVAMGGLQATPHPLGTGLLVPQHRRLRVPGRSRGHLGPGEAERLKWLWEWRRVLHGEQGIGTLARRSCDAAGVGPILESKARTPQGALEDPAFRRSARSRWHSPRRPRRTGSHWSRRTGRPVIPKIANRRPGLSRPLEAIPRWQRCWLPAICNRNRAPRSGDADAAGADGAARPGGVGVADLTLDDIDWRSGEITIAGRGNRRDRLPLPADAGEAIAAHLQHGWPAGALDRRVFIPTRAPWPGLTAGSHSGGGRGRRAGRAGHHLRAPAAALRGRMPGLVTRLLQPGSAGLATPWGRHMRRGRSGHL